MFLFIVTYFKIIKLNRYKSDLHLGVYFTKICQEITKLSIFSILRIYNVIQGRLIWIDFLKIDITSISFLKKQIKISLCV